MPDNLTFRTLMPQITWHAGERLRELSFFSKIRHLGMTTVRACCFDVHVEGDPNGLDPGAVIFFQSIRRPDYDELFENVAGAYTGCSAMVQIDAQALWGNVGRVFQPLSPLGMVQRTVGHVGRFWRYRRLFRRGIHEEGWWSGCWLVLQFLKLEPLMDRLLGSRPAGVVLFAEMQCMDRFLSWACRSRGVPCATMQHGLYAEYQKTPTVNVHNYQPGFVTDFLAWGEVTATLIHRYAPQVQTHLCGKPTRRPALCLQQEEWVYDGVILFDQNIFSEENQQMVDIVYAAFPDARIGVRFHPQNNPEAYRLALAVATTPDDWTRAKWFVGHTTTLLLDLMEAGVPVYRFQSGAESIFEPDPSMDFIGPEQLIQLIDKGAGQNDEMRLQRYVCCKGEDAIQAHVEAIRNMIEKEDRPQI